MSLHPSTQAPGTPPARRTPVTLLILVVGAGLLTLRLLAEPPILLAQPAKGRFEIVESRDSAYSSMQVIDHLFPAAGGQMLPVARQLRFSKYVQGAIFVHPQQQRGREHWSAVPYTDLFHLVRLFTPELERVLFIGGGVGVGPRSFRRHYPQAQIDLVEIDPVVVELAEKHFYFTSDEGMRVYVEDGRAFLRRNPDLQWDATILDAFSIGGRLPSHLMTQEFLESVKAHLTPDGVVLANLPSALAGEGGSLFRAEYRTFREVFPAVYVFPRHDPAEQDANSPAWWRRTRNVFVAATLTETRSKSELLA